MADGTKIEWTDATWNPITGCSIVSPGCTNCYAMKLAGTRLKHIPSRAGLTRDTKAGPVWTGEVRLNEEWLDQPLRWKTPRMIFVCAHGDLFAEGVPDEWIDRVFAVMALAPQHTFQVLTKRAERMRAYLTDPRTPGRIARCILDLCIAGEKHARAAMAGDRWPVRSIGDVDDPDDVTIDLPLPNVWLGVSAEDQKRADERVPLLLDTPAAVRWVSAEPLLGRIDFRHLIFSPDGLRMLDWIVAGGESGNGARPMHPDWVRSIRDQCAAADVAFLFKQWGAWASNFVQVSSGEMVFREFDTFQRWVDKAPTWVVGGICLDREGTQLRIGADFMRARDEDRFPVTIMHMVGKKAAGRMLDGVTHDAFPYADEVPFG